MEVHPTAFCCNCSRERTERVLVAMGVDGRSGTGDVARQMGKTPQQLSSTRQRLLFKRLIAEDGRGFVRYNLPRMRQYFTDPLEQVANQGPNVWKHE